MLGVGAPPGAHPLVSDSAADGSTPTRNSGGRFLVPLAACPGHPCPGPLVAGPNPFGQQQAADTPQRFGLTRNSYGDLYAGFDRFPDSDAESRSRQPLGSVRLRSNRPWCQGVPALCAWAGDRGSPDPPMFPSVHPAGHYGLARPERSDLPRLDAPACQGYRSRTLADHPRRGLGTDRQYSPPTRAGATRRHGFF